MPRRRKRPVDLKRVSGTVFLREQLRKSQDGRRVVMVIGFIAGLPDTFKGETQYAIAGQSEVLRALSGQAPGDPEPLNLVPEPIPLPPIDHPVGLYRADQILWLPIWRV